MSYPFTPEQICLLRLSTTVWKRRASAKRHQLLFGEESVTETILMDLADTFPGQVTIVPFNKIEEGRYGADWAWAFENSSRTSVLPMLVQAKLLDVRDTEYPEIKRFVGKTRIRQIDRLIETAAAWGCPSIYAFYNHLSDSTRVPQKCDSLDMSIGHLPESWGISVADAYHVRATLNDQTFDSHRNHSMALHCLLCSSGTGLRGDDGSPGLVLEALRRLRNIEGPVGDDGGHPPLPEFPFPEMPPLFRRAEEIIASSGPDDGQLDQLSRAFPTLAGVAIFRDTK